MAMPELWEIQPDGSILVPWPKEFDGIFADGVRTVRPGDPGYEECLRLALEFAAEPLDEESEAEAREEGDISGGANKALQSSSEVVQ